MDDTESMNTLTLADLNTVLTQMTGNDGNCETEEPCEAEVIINTINSLYNFCCHFYHIFKNNQFCYSLPFSIYLHSQIILQEKYDLIFQNAIITVIIFVVNFPVDFVSALMDQGNDFLIFFFFN